MAHWAASTTPRRAVWLFDSFEGLPEPTPEDGDKLDDLGPDQRTGTLEPIGKFVAGLEDVREVLSSVLDLNSDNIFIEKGWFQNTLPAARSRVGPIALLRLDADLYQSTKCCLENLYQNVAPGGSSSWTTTSAGPDAVRLWMNSSRAGARRSVSVR